MRTIFTLLTLFISSITTAQEIDYNTYKGYILEGYDVVSYFTKKTPTKGNNSFKTTYNGVNFKFSTQENLNAFKNNPEKYLPKYGGYCAYAVAKRKKKMEVDPTKYEIRDGKLYLFYNSWITNSLEDWQEEDTKKLQIKGDANWQKIQFKK